MPLIGIGSGRGLLYTPPVAAAAAAFSLTSVATPTPDLTTQTTYTFASQNFGTEHSSRVLAVCIMSRNSGGTQIVSSVSFPGAIPGIRGPNVLGSGNGDCAEIWYANVPTGTSGNVGVTFAGANQRCAINLYSIISPSSVAPTTTATSTVNTTVTSGSISIPAGGAAIMCCYTLAGGGAVTPTGAPAGFDNLDLNNNLTGAQQAWSIHSNAGAVTGTQTLTSTLASSTSNAACFAVWGP
jgi:hypothetical protein